MGFHGMSIHAHTFKLIVTHECTVRSSSAPVPNELLLAARKLVASGASDAAIAVPFASSGQAILKRVGDTSEVRGIMMAAVVTRDSGIALCEDLSFWARSAFTLGKPIDSGLETSSAGEAAWSVGLPVSPFAREGRVDARVSLASQPLARSSLEDPQVFTAVIDHPESAHELLPQGVVRACAFVTIGAVSFLLAVLAARAALGDGGAT